MKNFIHLFVCIFFSVNTIAQSYNDGPIDLQVKLREVQGNFTPTDESLLGIGFAPDELSFKIWTKDNLNTYPWTGGSCLQDLNFNPSLTGSNSIDFNSTFASFSFPALSVPQYLDLKIDAWEDDLPSDNLLNLCNTGTSCTWNDVECCGFYFFGFCIGIETGDDYRCNADPFYQGLSYRSGSPCQWYSHGYINGSGCVNPSSQSSQPNPTDGYYKPHIETFWRYTKGTSFANAIDLGVLTPGVINHFNSNECYSDYYPYSTGNDVIYSFNVSNPSGVNVSVCGTNGAQFDSYLYLVYDTTLTAIASNDNNCGNQSEISTSLCDVGTYYIVVDATSVSELGTFTLSLTEDPSFSFSSVITTQDVSCANGNDGEINVTLLGNGGQAPFTYNWYDINMNPIDSTIATVNILDSLIALDTGVYILQVFDDRNCILTDTIVLDSLEALLLSVNPVSPTICQGSSINIAVSGASIYTWFPSSTLNANLGSVVQASPLVSTTYSIIGEGVNGCEDTIQVDVGVIPGPSLSVFPSSANLCQGDSVSFFLSGAESYNWAPNTSISSISNDTVIANPVNNITYSVIGTNLLGCTSTIQIPVTVHANPSVSVSSSSNPICLGETSILSANGASAYNWQPSSSLNINTGTSVSAMPTSLTTYAVIGTDVNNCSATASITINVNPLPIISVSPDVSTICEGSSVVMTASGVSDFVWSPALGLNTTIGSSVIASPITTSSYLITGTDLNGCSDIISVAINVNPKPDIILAPTNADICEGSSINISAFGANTYNWTPSFGLSSSNSQSVIANPISSVNYTIIGMDLLGCTNFANFQLNVGIIPTVLIAPVNPIICEGENISLSASGANQYVWSPPLSLSASVGVMVNASPNISTTYTLVGTDNIGCIDSVSTTVSVTPLPLANITNTNDVTICSGNTAIIVVDVSGNPPWNLSYAINGASQSVITSTSNPTLILSDIAGEYTIPIITDANGCSNIGSGSLLLDVLNTPIASFDLFPQPANELQPEITFTNNSIFVENWYWDFGDGFSNISDYNTIHSYFEAGTYQVSLIVANGVCSDTIQHQLTIDPVYTLYVPDAFTPNNDGLNDIFSPKGQSISEFEMYVYNRWGEQVYYTDDINMGWNGKIENNKRVLLGEYSYILKIIDDLGVFHTIKGRVLLN